MKEELIAPCGMNCNICLGYFGYTVSGNKRKMKCPGCRPSQKGCSWVKKGCKNLTKDLVKYCYECKDLPCEKLKKIDKKYQERYNYSFIKNLEIIRDKGIEKFLELEKERFTCPKCKGYICVHDNICYNCKEKNR